LLKINMVAKSNVLTYHIIQKNIVTRGNST